MGVIKLNLAIFDLDKTLLPIDSDKSWGDFCVAKGWINEVEFARKNAIFYEAYLRGELDIYAYTTFASTVLVGKSHQELAAMHALYMKECIAPCILPPALRLVNSYRKRGWETILITATNEFIARPIAHALGFEHFIGIELERDTFGLWRNALRGIPSIGQGKVERLFQWLKARGLSWSCVQNSVMYSDSINDIPLLELAHLAVATNPDTYLLKVAQERNWEILHLFSESSS